MQRRGLRVPKTTFEKLLFACRWLLAPFYVALVVALIELLVKVAERAYDMVVQLQSLSEEGVILGALGIIDLTLCACLVILVVFSTYSNFVSRVEPMPQSEWPAWMAGIDYGDLKLKLVASIVAISAIKLLETYMNIDHESNRDLAWETGIFGSFVLAALMLGIVEAVGRAYGDHGS
jgi:uncharacterized protein (TIGR00645 family)